MRILIGALVLIAACAAPAATVPTPSGPQASTATVAPAFPSPTVEPTPTATPTRTATSSPTATRIASATPSATPIASPTLIALPSTASLSASGSVVWALVAGDHLFRSIDRGSTWEGRPWPTGGPAIPGVVGGSIVSFIDEHEGWLLRIGQPGTGCQQQDYDLWHTTDAATTWTKLSPETRPDAFVGGPLFGLCKDAMAFADPLRGVVVSEARDVPTSVQRTTDGGKTWGAYSALPDPPGFTSNVNSTYGLAPGQPRWFGTTILVAAQGNVGGQPQRFVFRSVDAGATWTFVATTPGAVGSFVAVTVTRWLQIGLPGEHQETTDGGASWHRYASDYSQAAPIAPQIVFGDENVGYATVRGAIQRTIDGGAHWTTIKTPGT